MKGFIIQESASSSFATEIKHTEHGTIAFVATLQEADAKNRNGRIYTKKVLEEALQSPYVQERLRTKTFYGEAGHPLETDIKRQMSINQRNIACIVTEVWWEGNLLKGRVETANTEAGRDMKGLIEQGSVVAFSLRAQGNVHYDPMTGAQVVEAPIQMLSYDWVVNPSHDKAFLERFCESTYSSLLKGRDQVSLNEAANLFENGAIFDIENEGRIMITENYTGCYGNKLKRVKDCYRYQDGDTLKEVSDDKIFATVVNENVEKKVFTEDFVLKDIRNLIKKL